MKESPPPPKITRRQWLEFQAMAAGANWMLAKEAVATTALANDWDLSEERTWQEWQSGK